VKKGSDPRAIISDWRERIGAAYDRGQAGRKLINRYNGAARAATSSDACARPIKIAIGHSASLVAAGLAATLARTPGCDISLRQIAPAACTCESAEPAQLVFGDSRMWTCIQAHNKSVPGACKLAKAKFVLVTSGDGRAATGSGAGDEFDECLSLDSQEQEI